MDIVIITKVAQSVQRLHPHMREYIVTTRQLRCYLGGVAEWVERWSRPTNFPYPTPDC